MKIGLILLFLSVSLLSISQKTLPDNFQIGSCVEVFNTDSIKIYFNNHGAVIERKCAPYYRVGKMDSTRINITGDFIDYYATGKVLLKATMQYNNLEGIARYYYENGRIKEEGSYRNNERLGRWTFYYPNGNIQKIYEYTDGEPLVLEAHNSNGEATVVGGNGSLKTEFSLYRQSDIYKATGNIKSGKKDGEWKWFLTADAALPISIETYDEGVFIKSVERDVVYTDKPMIRLTSFCANENLNLMENSIGCLGNQFSLWQYDSRSIRSSFYPKLQSELSKYSKPIQDQWLIVGIKISKNNKIAEINTASSINDTIIENYIYDLLLKMRRWEAAVINSKRVESSIFFTILVDNGQIIIPADYVFQLRRN